MELPLEHPVRGMGKAAGPQNPHRVAPDRARHRLRRWAHRAAVADHGRDASGVTADRPESRDRPAGVLPRLYVRVRVVVRPGVATANLIQLLADLVDAVAGTHRRNPAGDLTGHILC